MFLNYIKNFFTKKIVKNSLANVKLIPSTDVIKTVGIIFDETYFYEREALVQELVKNSIQEKKKTRAQASQIEAVTRHI